MQDEDEDPAAQIADIIKSVATTGGHATEPGGARRCGIRVMGDGNVVACGDIHHVTHVHVVHVINLAE